MTDAPTLMIDSVRSGDAVKFLQLSATEDAASVLVMQEAGEAGGCTLLGLAAILGHHHLVSPLLSAGVGVDDTGVSTRTPLHQAASYGHEDMTVALLKAGANIEAVSERDNGERALHLACRYGRTNLVKLLLQEGADIEATDNEKYRPLHCASYHGKAEVVKMLIRSGANTEAISSDRWRPLHRAALWGHLSVITELLDGGADIEAPGSWGNRAVHYAASRGQIPVLELLEERGCDLHALERLGGNALHSSSGGGHLKTVQWLVEKNVSYRATNNDGRTPEDMAQLYGQHHVAWWLHKQSPNPGPMEHTQTAVSQNEYERLGNITLGWARKGVAANITAHLPSRPYRIHYQDIKGWTALHHAAYAGQQNAVEALLSIGSFPHVLTHCWKTPADLALSQGHTQVTRLLPLHTHHLTRRERTHLYGRLVEEVSCAELKTAVMIGEKEEYERRILSLKKVTQLLMSGAPLEPPGGHSVFVLHLAITTNCTDLLPLLLSAGAPLTTTTGGMNLLQLAWRSPDVTTQIVAIVTRAIVHRIKYELTLVDARREVQDKPRGEADGEAVDEELSTGMEYLLKELQGPEAWRASWYSSERDHINLTRLLVRASYRGATLTAAFIQQRGGSVTSLTASGHTALHIALDAGHMQTVECLVRHMGANLFLCDGLGRLPLLLCPQDKRDQLLEDALCQAYRVLDFRMGKIRSGLEKQNLAYVMVLMAVLYNEADFFSSEANLPCMKHGLFPDVHLSSERTTTLSTEADLSSVETFPSRKWKEVFLQMAIMLRQIEERQFLDDNWLKDLLSCLSQKRIERNDTVTAAEVNDDLDLDEELFFLLIEELKKKHHSLSSENHKKDPELEDLLNSTLHRALRLCCECDLLLLTHLLFTVAAVPVDEIIDPVSGSTALHIVASHGRIGLMDYLLSRNASPSVLDHAGRTPAHLAYMFGHSAVGDCLCEGFEESRSKAGNCPKDLLVAFKKYLKMYHLEKNIRVPMHELNDPLALTRAHLQQFKWKWRSNFQRAVKNLHVDFTSGEAQEVQTILTEEIKKILSDQARINPLWEGDLQVLGSSADNLRLYAPDEFDCNVVLKKISGFPGGGLKVKHTPFPREVAEMKGYSTCVCVTAVNESLKSYIDGPNIVRLFSNDFLKCLENFKFSDNRLSFVPPGTRKTQVGISVSFAWEGSEFPLLLIEVDIVPILKIPWPASQQRPPMTPPDVDTLYISNTGDGEWRYSFAAIESRIFRALPGNRRLVFLACKLLIVTLKVVSWAPRDVKELFTYWNGRRFKIPAPAGFILKNTFLQEMEDVKDNAEWDTQKLYERMCSVFSRMCIRDYDVTSGTTRYFHGKVHAYFGGNTEKPSIGLAAPEILAFLESLKAS